MTVISFDIIRHTGASKFKICQKSFMANLSKFVLIYITRCTCATKVLLEIFHFCKQTRLASAVWSVDNCTEDVAKEDKMWYATVVEHMTAHVSLVREDATVDCVAGQE